MITSDIRRKNARALALAVGSPAEFGRRTGMSDSQISQLIGENPTKNIGNIIARRIEMAFGKEPGWIDVLQGKAAIADVSAVELMALDSARSRPEQSESVLIAPSTHESYVSAADIAELVALFSAATLKGRKLILDAARSAKKATGRRGIIAFNQAK